MASLKKRYQRYSRRRYRIAAESYQRLDLQGLRMVAVLTVFANHLWHWPRGGFVGVDVFFVISGFLITGNLLRTAEKTGAVSFRHFYWNRIRRIVPAATVVLVLTYVAATFIFKTFRAHEVGVDALFAFIFMSNWRFAMTGTDYFNPDTSTSPLQHYWSLSIEEQFYFVWPALIFVISLVVLRNAWTHERRMRLAGAVMGLVIATSLGWAIYESARFPAWAYFDTFSRVWELGVGALLACAVGFFAQTPTSVKPVLSWSGLGLIAASLVLISDGSTGFPAPWALLPVVGAALVIVAGVGGEPKYQSFLRNPISTYIGDFSYSLYLVHWPIIILLGVLMDRGVSYFVAVIALAFGAAIASYHFVENPLRRIDLAKLHRARRALEERRVEMPRAAQLAAISAATLLVVGSLAFAARPNAYRHATLPPDISVAASHEVPMGQAALPQAIALRDEIRTALKATEWPQFNPSVETLLKNPIAPPDVERCGYWPPPTPELCTWGSPTAGTRAVMIGDSVAMSYVGPLHDIALTSNGALQIHSEAQYSCHFLDVEVADKDPNLEAACAKRREAALDYINRTHPDMVIISHFYWPRKLAGSGAVLQPQEWAAAIGRFIDKFRANTKKIVFIAPPPDGIPIAECYEKQSSTPADCISKVSDVWKTTEAAEQQLARSIGATFVDSISWFCYAGERCPIFVTDIPTRRDMVHMTISYGQKITPVMQESLKALGVF